VFLTVAEVVTLTLDARTPISMNSQRRRCGLVVLRMLVRGAPRTVAGRACPQRPIVDSRTPSGASRTMGAM
jgi:hypothetical protein